jgi:uncharacterized Fe-S cluster-containing radical SAM superfamily protein
VKTIFDNGSQCTFHIKNDSGIVNSQCTLVGLPFVFYKDCIAGAPVRLPFANAFSLSARGTTINKTRGMDIINACEPIIGKYNIENLISINGGSYQNKTIRLGINKTLFDQASNLHDYHIQVRSKINDQWNNVVSKLKS